MRDKPKKGMLIPVKMAKFAVILFGTPGSGKGMQADLIAKRYGLMHVDTGQIIRNVFSDPEALKDKTVQKEKKMNDAGILNTPSWVLDLLKNRVHFFSQSGYGVVFSGSPRTEYESKGLLPFLEKEFGRKNVFAFYLDVPPATTMKRNKNRLVCAFCKRPLLSAYYPSKNPKHCPNCGGKLEKRKDDTPGVYKVRYNEYLTRTKPAIDIAKKRGYAITKIDGSPAPYLVFEKISKKLPKR